MVVVGLPMLKIRPEMRVLGTFSVCSPPSLTFELLGHKLSVLKSSIGSREHMTGSAWVVAGLPMLKKPENCDFGPFFGSIAHRILFLV